MVGGESGASTGAKNQVWLQAVPEASLNGRKTAMPCMRKPKPVPNTKTLRPMRNCAALEFSEAPPGGRGHFRIGGVASRKRRGRRLKKNGGPTGEEAVIRKNGKPVVGDGLSVGLEAKNGNPLCLRCECRWSRLVRNCHTRGHKDKQAGITRIKQELEKYLQEINYDDPTKTKGGAQIVTGTGKAKRAGVDVVFAAGVFEATPGQLAGIAFVADKDLNDHYKEAARYICGTIRTGEDLARPKQNVEANGSRTE